MTIFLFFLRLMVAASDLNEQETQSPSKSDETSSDILKDAAQNTQEKTKHHPNQSNEEDEAKELTFNTVKNRIKREHSETSTSDYVPSKFRKYRKIKLKSPKKEKRQSAPQFDPISPTSITRIPILELSDEKFDFYKIINKKLTDFLENDRG